MVYARSTVSSQLLNKIDYKAILLQRAMKVKKQDTAVPWASARSLPWMVYVFHGPSFFSL